MSAQSLASNPLPSRTPAAPARTPIGAPAPAPQPVFCFSVLADAEPGVMPRVLELFAKRGLVPWRWVSDVSGPGGCDLSIGVQVSGLTPETHAYLARCLRQIWGVHTVLTSEKGGLG